ncbi:hypothetical protein [Yinghuangia sp. YIM S09857]|uniref:hypothetical protein n=1 Tax=Yinghuangia sp. YIM S09857 TaxID=3436929 RepID=UPI003F529F3C
MGACFRPASERRAFAVYISGIRTGHLRTLDALDVIDELRAAGRVFDSTPEAIAAARHNLHHTGILAACDMREDSRMESAR